ncbi:MAG: TonB-dependent receptor [Ignavibacteriales bacterium]|nr:TonB-dependent receptor [Ignavibacteriales bacterium]
MKSYNIFLTILFTIASFAQQHKGNITGKVVDSKTMEPVPSVHIVVIEKSNIGTASDLEGIFKINDIDVGTYSLRISAVGYSTQVITNIVTTTGRATPILIKLDETVVELGEVTTNASYFSRAQQMSPVSSNLIDRSDVLRSPGGIQDVQRVAQNLPGVASSTDNINELIVRGGAPYENLTIMDNMEIPSINHYSNQFNSAGPINMVNADMIEDVKFSSGGFPAQYGDKSSSVMDLTVREGNRSKAFASKTSMNMAGVGTLVEGGFADGKGSYILSARNSLLEIIDKVVGISKISLTSIPKYWDLQSKFTYDLSQSHKLMLNVLYGDSRINIEGDPEAKDELRKNTIDSSSVEVVYPAIKQHGVGLSLRSLLGKDGYSIATIYSSGTSVDEDVREDFAVRTRDSQGETQSHQILNTIPTFSNHAVESFLGTKYELFYQIHPLHALSLGAQFQTISKWKNDVWFAADTSQFDLNRDGTFEPNLIIVPEGLYRTNYKFGAASRYYTYISDRFSISSQLALTFGLRYDHFTYSGRGNLSPRGSISYQIVPSASTITFAAGEYYQTQPFPYYGDRRQLNYNKNLENMKSTHYVLGYEHIFDHGLKASIETYFKSYKKAGVSEDFIYSAIDTFWSDKMLAIGERYAYGLEFFLEQKQVEEYFGTLSISLSKTKMKDPRIPKIVDWYSSEYDYPVVITALAGKVVKGVRDWCNNAPFFIKYPSYILPLSNEMEISFKYRFQSGRPYTPLEYITWKQDREGGVKWSRGSWISTPNENSARYPNYSRLDLQWLSRFYMTGWNINVYVALMNVTNTKNVFYENHRSDGTVETVYQFSFFPVLGVEAEF